MIPHNRNLVVEKLMELKSRKKVAEHFNCNYKTLCGQLTKWGVTVSFRGQHLKNPHAMPSLFKKDQVVMWVPVTARQKCYGLPIATMPIKSRILADRTPRGNYKIEVIDSAARIQLRKSIFTIHENALKELRND